MLEAQGKDEVIDSLALHLEPFLAWLLRTTWQASLLVGLILLLQKVLGRRFGVRGRHCLWLLVLLRLALPWTLPSRVSVYNLLPSAPLRGYQTSGAPAQRASTPALTLEGYPDPSPAWAGSGVFVPLVERSPPIVGRGPGLPPEPCFFYPWSGSPAPAFWPVASWQTTFAYAASCGGAGPSPTSGFWTCWPSVNICSASRRPPRDGDGPSGESGTMWTPAALSPAASGGAGRNRSGPIPPHLPP